MPGARRPSLLICWLFLLVMLSVSPAGLCQQALGSRVDIIGAGNLLPLLNDNLQIVRLTHDASVTEAESAIAFVVNDFHIVTSSGSGAVA